MHIVEIKRSHIDAPPAPLSPPLSQLQVAFGFLVIETKAVNELRMRVGTARAFTIVDTPIT